MNSLSIRQDVDESYQAITHTNDITNIDLSTTPQHNSRYPKQTDQ